MAYAKMVSWPEVQAEFVEIHFQIVKHRSLSIVALSESTVAMYYSIE